MSISSDEVNFLIYRYLQENGFSHSAFTFAYESMVVKSTVAQTDLPPGALITFLQKGLEYTSIEEHINEDGSIRDFDNNYSLLSPFICDAVATKEDRRRHPLDHISMDEIISGSAAGEQPQSDAPSAPLNLGDSIFNSSVMLSGHQGEVFMCVWNPSQRQLVSGSADGMCRLWHLTDAKEAEWALDDGSEVKLRTTILPHMQTVGERFKDVTSVTWSPDGRSLATGCYDGVARVWDSQGNLKMVLKEHSGPVFSLKWNKKGTLLLSGSYDRRALVWAAQTGQLLKSFSLHSSPVLDVDWKDDDMFASCSSDMTINVCQVSSSNSSASCKFTGHSDEVNAVVWSPGGGFLASCSDDTSARIWSPANGLIHELRGHAKEIYTVRWTPTGPDSANPDKQLMLCTASFDGTVKVWLALSGELLLDLRRHSQPVYSISASPRGDFLATGSLGGHVSVWSLTDGSMVEETQGAGDTFDVSWSHDGSLLGACFSSGTLHVIDASGIKERHAMAVAAAAVATTGSGLSSSAVAAAAVSGLSSSTAAAAGNGSVSSVVVKDEASASVAMDETNAVVIAGAPENGAASGGEGVALLGAAPMDEGLAGDVVLTDVPVISSGQNVFEAAI